MSGMIHWVADLVSGASSYVALDLGELTLTGSHTVVGTPSKGIPQI